MAWCQGDVEGCVAEESHCGRCGVTYCHLHGHADEGDDPDCVLLRVALALGPDS